MIDRGTDYGVEFLLTFDGHICELADDYWMKFEIKRVEATTERPHGLVYSLTLHAPDGVRLLGFDNAHGVPAAGSRSRRSPAASDHWHRTENDPGRPYAFNDADTLLADFFREVRRVLTERGVSYVVIRVEEKRQ